MAKHVDNYEDEWAATLKDPERLRKFRTFVNAPDAPDLGFPRVAERGQSRPATEEELANPATVLVAGTRIPLRGEIRDGDAL